MIRDTLRAGLRRLLRRDPRPAAPKAATPRSPAPAAPVAEAPVPTIDTDEVSRLIDEQIRPALQRDGGDIELVEVVGADVHVRLQGACRGCPGASMTLRMGVEALLRDEIPGFGRVVDLG
ncbi:MAG: NifU family protein [Pseudomonadota bacterium]